MRAIAAKFTKECIPTPSGKGVKWHGSTISTILDIHNKYEGGVINGNINEIGWPVILTDKYPDRIK